MGVLEHGGFKGTLDWLREVIVRNVRMYSDDLVEAPIVGADDWDLSGGIGVNSTTKGLESAKSS